MPPKGITVQFTGQGIGFQHVPSPHGTHHYVSKLITKERGTVTVSEGKCLGLQELRIIHDCETFEHGTYKCFSPECSRPCSTIVRKLGVSRNGHLFAMSWPSCGLKKHNREIETLLRSNRDMQI